MNSASWIRSGLACLTIAISTASCATVENRLTAAAETKGKVEVGVDMPDQPDDCRVREAHADVKAGTEAKAVLIRERAALDRQNARTGRCADFYDDVKAKLETASPKPL